MACVDELFMWDEGTSIEFLIQECDDFDIYNPVLKIVDVSTATDFELTFLKPDGSTLVKTNPDVKILNDGTDGLVHYITIATDLDQPDKWYAQLRITMPLGRWYASERPLKVKTPIG